MSRARIQIRGEWRLCANPDCRRRFSSNTYVRTPSRALGGLCPRCVALVQQNNAKRMNPKLYAECQRVNRAEKLYGGTGNVMRMRALEREALKRYDRWAAKRPMPVHEAERLLTNGYTPTANNGKVGRGPNGGRE